ncbi:hypothetical protein BJ878DRAFT_530562 [Calycina marina]|uniref:Uncharacterized protein n=1 Tax=Calycina marina TaxID=1763456 RepID=A0A9P7YVG8_9HELO|nr:hypothetical protein BJ878DRAFT_530562 [Calycina marina]
MKFAYTLVLAASISVGAADSQILDNRATASTNTQSCSLGIGRVQDSPYWDVTVYNIPQAARQDVNIIAKATNQFMPKSGSITISPSSLALPITITNIDNAPTFTYDEPALKAPVVGGEVGTPKVELMFVVGEGQGNTTWTTAGCWAVNVAFTAGIEGWSCDFPCTVGVEGREL